jgi:OmcA/MtrC family decaheme c-type cytochrome
MKARTAVRLMGIAALSLAAACGGSDGKNGTNGTTCTVTNNADGTKTLACSGDGGAVTLANGTSGTNGKSCSVAAVDGGSQITCEDGRKTFIPNAPTADAGGACDVSKNGDGTWTITCPGDDGGTESITVKEAVLDYATMSAANKAALDLKITVTSVTVPASNQPVVAFKVIDVSGNAVKNLPPGDLRFGLLKLVAPATATSGLTPVGVNASALDTWVSYMAASPTSTAGTETAAAAATATSNVLTDSGDGSYLYTFIRKVTDAGVTYDPKLTHRLVMILSESGNPFAPVNLVKDFIPATGKDVSIDQNRKVDGLACLKCHGSFRAKAGGTGAFHGGARYDVEICVACHNDQRRLTAIPGTGTTPAVNLDTPGAVSGTPSTWAGNATIVNGEAFINLPVFIHKIHMGEELTLKGGTYSGMPMPYEVTYPQDVRNCDMCHRTVAASDNHKVVQADNFKTKPSRRACGACHDDISFAATPPAGRKAHSGGDMADDSSCAVCHPATRAKSLTSIGVLEAHIAVDGPNPEATWLGGANANTNAAYLPAAGQLPTGAVPITYDVKSVSRDAAKHASIVFRFMNGKTPVVFNVAGAATELMDNFVGSPSAYFAYALPQDGDATPADFNATVSGYIRNIWNGTATGAGAGTMTFDDASGYYTITLTGVTIPDEATMLTGGIGYSYSLSSTPPLTQINLPAYPYADATLYPKCIAGKKCGGLIVPSPNVWMVATDAASAKAYTTRRPIVANAKCLACHEQLGAKPTFHAGQRNDGPTCSFCHNPNRTSSGWSASSGVFVHAIHGAAKRTVGDSWHAACPPGTTYPTTCTLDNADPYYAKVTYPGVLSDCQQCHLPGTNDFSATASAQKVDSLMLTTVATGVLAPSISVSPYVKTDGTDYGNAYSVANLTSGTYKGVACTAAAPCVCSPAAPCEAADTTLVSSPVTAVCSSCHDAKTSVDHMKMMGGSFYEARSVATTKAEQCLICHGAGKAAAIALVHQ